MNEQTANRKNIEAHIIAKTWKNTAYKEELLSNPKLVYEKELNTEFSPEINVEVLEEDSKTFYFVLPVCPEISELSEEQLEAIAGGGWKAVGSAVAENIDKVGEQVKKSYNNAKDFGAEAFRASRGGCE